MQEETFQNPERTSGDGWRLAVVDRCNRALAQATALADRLALYRTLAWLLGGRVELDSLGIHVCKSEAEASHRFGLAISEEGVVRLLEGRTPPWSPELHVEGASRRAMLPGSADAILLRYSPNRRYQSQGQKGAIRALVMQPPGTGLMTSLPTGAGKSLLFQLAALRGRTDAAGACVVVVTPTVALALDHERSLSTIAGLEGSRALTGDQPRATSQSVINAFRRGEVPVLLLGPEAALRPDVAAALAEAARPQDVEHGLNARLTHLFVDEAHIVESWGRGFRPDFQRLPGLLARLREANPDVRLVLLSATLTPSARHVLRQGWGDGRPWLEVDARVPRYEHDVLVEKFPTAEARRDALAWAVDFLPRPAIIYTTEVDQAKDLHRWLSAERGYGRTAVFTGDTGADERRDIVTRWARDEIDLIVATSAFGMGVDKADVRSVIHACLPEGPSRWYQEIGRAARDGGQGVAALLFTSDQSREDDVFRARGLAVGGWLTRDLAEKRWAAMVRDARDKSWIDGLMTLTVDLDAIREGLKPRSSDYNRGWNMALLTLLQRAGAIEIQSVSGGDDVVGKIWSVRVTDHELLGGTMAAWDRVFLTREAEVERARAEAQPFFRVAQQPTKACVTRTAFELIEPAAYAPPCGRCPSCRAEGVAPPHDLPCGGLDVTWPFAHPYDGPLPAGPLVLQPDDLSLERDQPRLLQALVSAGVEQFIVPDSNAFETAAVLSGSAADLGLVLMYSECSGQKELARAATALLFPTEVAGADWLVPKLVAWGAEAPFPVIIVADGARLISDRRLDQWVSRFAPLTQAWLDDLAERDAVA